MKFYQLADIAEAGKISFNKEKMNGMLQTLFPGRYLLSFQRLEPKSSIKDYRRCYFAKIDALGSETGHSRYEMHDLVKNHLLTQLLEQIPEIMVNDVISTSSLNEEGWTVLLEALDLWAFTEYSVILN